MLLLILSSRLKIRSPQIPVAPSPIRPLRTRPLLPRDQVTRRPLLPRDQVTRRPPLPRDQVTRRSLLPRDQVTRRPPLPRDQVTPNLPPLIPNQLSQSSADVLPTLTPLVLQKRLRISELSTTWSETHTHGLNQLT